MNRAPRRPLARTLAERQRENDPEAIERENERIRLQQRYDSTGKGGERRMWALGAFFFCAFFVIALRMGQIATAGDLTPPVRVTGTPITSERADIVDRKGNVLAMNLPTHALYAQPNNMVDPKAAARGLAEVFADLDEEDLIKDFTGKRKFLWLKKTISPEQLQAVHDIGEPGLLFAPRDMRLYPNTNLAAHVMGGARYGRQGVRAAEIVGVAGVEKYFDDYLRDPANRDEPLRLSLDLTVQAAAEEVLYGGMKLMNAKGATSVLMDVHSGEVISAVSLPDFDPNNRPRPATEGDASDSPLFNRSVQGVYELGSVFKIFTAAQSIDMGLTTAETVIDTSGPMKVDGYRIGEFNYKDYGELSVADIIVHSSNRGTGKMALEIGAEQQQAFLKSLGFFEPTPFEIVEASGGRPLLPRRWTDLSTVTVSYGHGLSTSPMHLAAGYAAIANGGHKVAPTLLKQDAPKLGPRVMSETAADAARKILRRVVQNGTATFAEVSGYQVGGKTGTADKPRPDGKYYEDKVIATFASIFPAHDPKYVLVVTLDEPEITALDKPRRTAGWTAVPVAAELTRRIAPLLGLKPQEDPIVIEDIELTGTN